MNETFIVESETRSNLFDDSLDAGGSTRSLLTPLYASDYESRSSSLLSTSSEFSEDEESLSDELKINKRYTKTVDFETERKPREFVGRRECYSTRIDRDDFPRKSKQQKIFTKSWEEWLIEKAVEDLKQLELKREMQQKEKITKMKKTQERKKIDKQVEENRLKWLAQKNFEYEKHKKEKAAQREYEKLKKQQKEQIISNKAKKAYNEWLEKKKVESKEQKEKEKEQQIELQMKKIEQTKLNEISYRKWKQKAKQQKRQNSKGNDRKDFDFYDIASGPEPTYVNPVPWKSIVDTRSYEKRHYRYKDECCFQSPPLLWKEREERLLKKTLDRKGVRTQTKKGHY